MRAGPMRERRKEHATRHTGFTLIEVLVVIVLTSIIASAAFQAVYAQVKLEEASRRMMIRIQLERGIVEDLKKDLDDVIRPYSPGVFTSISASESSLELETEIAEQFLALPRQKGTLPLRFYGTSTTLALETIGTGGRFPILTKADSKQAASAQVLWFCARGQTVSIPAWRQGEKVCHASVANGSPILRLCRVEVPSAEGKEGGGAFESSAVLTPFVVSESVDSMALRYFDGDHWRDRWDALVEGRLPVALEVTLESQLFDRLSVVIRLHQGEIREKAAKRQ